MYERFTDRARKVMQLSNQEAQRFGHEYIGTEHVLIGLVKEGSGVASNVLKNLGADLATIRQQVENIVQGPTEDFTPTMGKLPQTPRTKKVIEYAIDEAMGLKHNYVGTEHILLGLIREGEGIAAQVFANLKITAEQVRAAIMELLTGKATGEGELTEKTVKDIVTACRTAALMLNLGAQMLEAYSRGPMKWQTTMTIEKPNT